MASHTTNVNTGTADQLENYVHMLRAAGVEEVYSDTGYSPLPALDSPSSTELESPHEGTLPSQPTSNDQGGLHTSGGSRDGRQVMSPTCQSTEPLRDRMDTKLLPLHGLYPSHTYYAATQRPVKHQHWDQTQSQSLL